MDVNKIILEAYDKIVGYSIELEERIDKAIEYIEDNLYPVGCSVHGSDLPYDVIQPLVEILKGE